MIEMQTNRRLRATLARINISLHFRNLSAFFGYLLPTPTIFISRNKGFCISKETFIFQWKILF
jgi:hypothetical protein